MAEGRSVLWWCMFMFIVQYCDASSLLIRKCCPESQELDWTVSKCVQLLDHREHASAIIKQQNSKDFLDFPWWLSSELKSETGLNSVFGNSSEFHIELGATSCEFDRTVVLKSNDTLKYSILNNGSLLYHTETTEDAAFLPTSYCADRVVNNDTYHHVFLLCPCLHTNCVEKCCAHDEIMEISNRSECVKHGSNVTSSPHGGSIVMKENVQSNNYLFNCSTIKELGAVNTWVLRNATVLSGFDEENAEKFCGEMAVVHSSTTTGSAMLKCTLQEPPKETEKMNEQQLSFIIYGVSAIFLIITLVVFAVVPETRNTKSNIIICHIVSLLAVYILRTTGRRPENGVFSASECYTLFFLHHFFYLSASFWMTAFCLDIAWTFRL